MKVYFFIVGTRSVSDNFSLTSGSQAPKHELSVPRETNVLTGARILTRGVRFHVIRPPYLHSLVGNSEYLAKTTSGSGKNRLCEITLKFIFSYKKFQQEREGS